MAIRCLSCAHLVSPETGRCPRCGVSLVVPLRLSWLARLLWACPACGAEVPLVLRQPFFGAASLGCRICGTAWVLEPEGQQLCTVDPATGRPAQSRPLADWLAQLPPPFTGRTLPAPHLLLAPGETCLVRVERARMLTPRQATSLQQPIGRVAIMPGIYERVAADPSGPNPLSLAVIARGPFSVTDRRVVFLGDRKHVEASLNRLGGVEVDEGFLIIHRPGRTDSFGFEGDSAARVRAAILLIARGDWAAQGDEPASAEDDPSVEDPPSPREP